MEWNNGKRGEFKWNLGLYEGLVGTITNLDPPPTLN